MAVDGKIMYKTIPEEPGVYQFFNKENVIFKFRLVIDKVVFCLRLHYLIDRALVRSPKSERRSTQRSFSKCERRSTQRSISRT